MEKTLIFFVMILMIVPFVFADTNTDFSRPYIQDKCYSGGTGDCYTDSSYLLRSTELDTGINYSDAAWTDCSVILGGSDFGGIPFSYYDPSSAFEHNSFLVLKESSIQQISSDCAIFDEYTFSGKAISQIGLANGGYTIGLGDKNLPYIAFVYNKTSNGNLYLVILSINSETSELELHSETYVGTVADYGGYEYIMGVAGGSIYSELNTIEATDTYFGFYSRKNDKFVFVTDQDDDGIIDDYYTVLNATVRDDDSSSHQLYFDDWNADGFNDFILLTYENQADMRHFQFELNYITPAFVAPYYTKTNDDYEYAPASSVTAHDIYLSDGYITLCQIGSSSSVLEACASIQKNYSSTSRVYGSIIINNNFDADIAAISGTHTEASSKFMSRIFQVTVGTEDRTCIPQSDDGAGNYMVYKCYNSAGTLRSSFNTASIPDSTGESKMDAILTSIDGDSTDYELLFGNGKTERINWNGTNTGLTDWTAFDDTYDGDIFVQDISGDDIAELIYIDSDIVKIYSMNDTAFVTMNASSFISGVTTTTVSGTTTTTLYDFGDSDLDMIPDIFEAVAGSLKIWIGLALILALAIMGGVYSRGHPLVIGLGAIIGAVIGVTIGLISTGVLIIMMIAIIGLMVLGFTLMKPGQ